MAKFDRVAELKIRFNSGKPNFNLLDTITITNLRVAFQITKSLSWSTNQASIQVYNLSPEKRAKIKDYADEIRLSAGYAEDTGAQLLFVGDSTQASHIFEPPDIITSIQCGDGERILNQRIISVSYSEDISARTIIQDVANKVGLNIGYFAPTPAGVSDLYLNGFQDLNLAKNIIEKCAKKLKLTQSVQNGALYLIPNQGSTERPPVIISQNTGMISTPQRYTYKRLDLWRGGPKQGYKVKTLLRPEILPGDKVRLISQRIDVDQIFYVDAVKHVGDTWGESWYSDWEIVEL